MNKVNNKRRILLVVTERSPLQRLWDAVEKQLAGTHEEVIALLVNDERWRRAASLSFTREVSRVSGTHREFTKERAAQLDRDMIGRVRAHLRELATNAELQPMFEVVAEHEASQIHEYVKVEEDVLVMSADLKDLPIYRELTRLSCRTVFVDAQEQDHK